MLLITKITPTKKIGFNNIFVNQKYLFTISDFTLSLFKIKETISLQQKDIQEILTTELTERFKNYSLATLSSRPKSEKEIENKLKERIKKYKETWPIFGKLTVKSGQIKVEDVDFKNSKPNLKTYSQSPLLTS